MDQYFKRSKYEEDLYVMDCLFGDEEMKAIPRLGLMKRVRRFGGSLKKIEKDS
jgi:hypothetical protein